MFTNKKTPPAAKNSKELSALVRRCQYKISLFPKKINLMVRDAGFEPARRGEGT